MNSWFQNKEEEIDEITMKIKDDEIRIAEIKDEVLEIEQNKPP